MAWKLHFDILIFLFLLKQTVDKWFQREIENIDIIDMF